MLQKKEKTRKVEYLIKTDKIGWLRRYLKNKPDGRRKVGRPRLM